MKGTDRPQFITENESEVIPEVNITRRLYRQEILDADVEYHEPRETIGQICGKVIRNCGFVKCLRNPVPIIKWLPKYKIKEYLISDIIAGVTAAIMLIPQGMAYALLAEVPPILGLYTAFFPVLVYVIFGTSPHVSLGSFSVACIMAGEVVDEYANQPVEGDPESTYTPAAVLSSLTMIAGMFQILMWCLRLGALTSLLSDPLVSGFTTGASAHVMSSQLKELFGIKLPPLPNNYKVIFTAIGICRNLTKTNLTAFMISFITCFLLAVNNEHLKPWIMKRYQVPPPAELIAMVTGTILTKFLKLQELYKINIVGDIPMGLPMPKLPPFKLFGSVLTDGLMQTIVTYTITLSMGLIFASKNKYEIDPNQELLAMGASNIVGSFFCCSPLCASMSRSYIQYKAGCKTLVTALVSAFLMLQVLLWIGQFFDQLPRCVLASIVVVSLKGLFVQVKDLKKFIRLSKIDGIVWSITFLVTLVVNLDIGLAAGLLASLASLIIRAGTPYMCVLGRVMETDIFLDVERYRGAREIPGIKIFRYCGALNFTNKNMLHNELYRKIYYNKLIQYSSEQQNLGTKIKKKQDENLGFTKTSDDEINATILIKCVIFDASGVSYIDVPGVRMLLTIQTELAAIDVNLLLAGFSGPVLEIVRKFNSLEDGLRLRIFPTICDAVLYYQTMIATKSKTPMSNITTAS